MQQVLAEGWLISSIVRLKPMSKVRSVFWPIRKGEIDLSSTRDLIKPFERKKVRVIIEEIE